MRVLVTGAAGFLGSHLVDRLVTDGHQVVAVDNLSTGTLDNLADARRANLHRRGAFRFVRLDVRDGGLRDVFLAERPEVVYHLAGHPDPASSLDDPQRSAGVTVLGTVNLLDSCVAAGSRKVVYASSATIHGCPEQVPVTERAGVDPLTPYAAAHAAVEEFLTAYRASHSLDYTVLTVANTYGPRQSPYPGYGVVAVFAHRMLAGLPTEIRGDGTQRRDFIHVDDVVDAFARFGGDVASGRRLNVATGVATSVRDVHYRIATAVGSPDQPRHVAADRMAVAALALDPRAARQLGWEPYTPLDTGIPATVRWIRQAFTRYTAPRRRD
ncbi:MAG: NAD-dependent epimerase/dehydratase family protein [Mycobacteriales bacterium]